MKIDKSKPVNENARRNVPRERKRNREANAECSSEHSSDVQDRSSCVEVQSDDAWTFEVEHCPHWSYCEVQAKRKRSRFSPLPFVILTVMSLLAAYIFTHTLSGLRIISNAIEFVSESNMISPLLYFGQYGNASLIIASLLSSPSSSISDKLSMGTSLLRLGFLPTHFHPYFLPTALVFLLCVFIGICLAVFRAEIIEESVLIIHSLGVRTRVTTRTALGRVRHHRKFYSATAVQGVAINEAITLQRVIFYLTLVTRSERLFQADTTSFEPPPSTTSSPSVSPSSSSSSLCLDAQTEGTDLLCKLQLVPLFSNSKPRLCILQQMYRYLSNIPLRLTFEDHVSTDGSAGTVI